MGTTAYQIENSPLSAQHSKEISQMASCRAVVMRDKSNIQTVSFIFDLKVDLIDL